MPSSLEHPGRRRLRRRRRRRHPLARRQRPARHLVQGRYPTEGIAQYPPSPRSIPGYRGNAPAPVDLAWQVKGVGDFDGDGRADILWRHDQRAGGDLAHGRGPQRRRELSGRTGPGRVWQIQGVGDFDGDGRSDILWRDVATASSRSGSTATRPARRIPSYRNVPGPSTSRGRCRARRTSTATAAPTSCGATTTASSRSG